MTSVESFDVGNLPINLIAHLTRVLTIKFDAQKCHFSKAGLEKLSDHLLQLLMGMCDHEDLCLSDLQMLTTDERNRLLHGYNQTAREYPAERCIHQWFEAMVEAHPDNTALRFEDIELSYADYNIRANRLADYLISEGIEPGERVGICTERSLEMMIAIMAVLKAGGAYVPLDPGYPKQRLSFIVEDAEIELVLVQSALMDSVPLDKVDVLPIDEAGQDADWLDEFEEDNPEAPDVPAADLAAYVLYTSGSTGKPQRGANLSQRGVELPGSHQL